MSDTNKAVLMEDLDDNVMLVDVIDTHVIDLEMGENKTEIGTSVVGPEIEEMETSMSKAGPIRRTRVREEIVSVVPMRPSIKTPAGQLSKSKSGTKNRTDDLNKLLRTYKLDYPFKNGYVARHLLTGKDSFIVKKLIQYLDILKIPKEADEQRLLECVKCFRKQFDLLMRQVSIHSKEARGFFKGEFKIPFLLEESPVEPDRPCFEKLSTQPKFAVVSSFVYQPKPAVAPTLPAVHSEPSFSNRSLLAHSNHTVSTGSSSAHLKKSMLTPIPLAASKHDHSTSSCSAQSKQVQHSSSLSAYLKSILSAPLAQPEETLPATTSSAQPKQILPATTSSAQPKQTLPAATSSAQPKQILPADTSSAQPKQILPAATSSAQPKQIPPATSSAQPKQIPPAATSSASAKAAQVFALHTASSKSHNPSTSCSSILSGSADSIIIPQKAESLHSNGDDILSAASKPNHLKAASHSSFPSSSELVSSSADFPPTRTYASRIECSQCSYKRSLINSLRCRVALLQSASKTNNLTKSPRRSAVYYLMQQLKRKEESAALWKRRYQRNKVNVSTMKMMSYQWVTGEQKLTAAVKKCQELFLQTEELQSQLKSCKNELESCKSQLKNDKKEAKGSKKLLQERDTLLSQVGELRSSLEAVKSKCKKEHVKPADWNKGKILIDEHWDERHDNPDCHPDLLKIIYKCVMHKLSQEACEDIVQYIFLSLCGRPLRYFPKRRTLNRCNLELSVLADLHVCYCLYHDYKAATVTLHTVKCDSHCINQVHVTSPSGQKLKIDLTIIPGGEPEDNYAHVSQTLLDIIEIFCPFIGQPGIAVKEVLLGKIKKSDSEKAKVHNFVVRRLKEEFDLDLLELKCSVHPLDGFAQAAKTTLARMDRNWELSTTEDCSLVDMMIYNVVKMRFCSNVGDPHGFHAFIKEKKLLNKGFNVRYMGNRPCVLFHMSAAVYNIRGPLVEYLSQVQKKKLAARIVEVLKNPYIEIQLQCMALFSMFLCVPWMREFFKNPKDTTQAVKKDRVFKMCMVALARVVSEPDLLFTTQSDVFGDPLELEESILQDVRSKSELYLYHAKKYQDCIVELATAFSDTLQCLVTDNLQGLFPEATEALLAATSTAVPYKVSGDIKRTLGLIDAVWRRAPHANVAHLNGKLQAKANKTIEWLDTKLFSLSNQFLNFAGCCTIKSKLYSEPKKKDILTNLKDHVKKKKSLEKLIEDSLKKGDDVLSLAYFKSLDKPTKKILQDFVLNDSALSDKVLRHVWQEEGKEATYLELIKCVDNVSNSDGDVTSQHVFLYYWKEGEDTANTYLSLKMSRFLAEFAAGDLVLK